MIIHPCAFSTSLILMNSCQVRQKKITYAAIRYNISCYILSEHSIYFVCKISVMNAGRNSNSIEFILENVTHQPEEQNHCRTDS